MIFFIRKAQTERQRSFYVKGLQTKSTCVKMLSAEHYALENELVRSVLEIKQKEIEFYLDRFSAIATQSALLLGVVTGGFASFDSGKFDHTDHPWLKNIEKPYIYCGTLSLICSLDTIMVATFAGIWGPSLALRGPGGSVTKAYYVLKKQSKHVMLSFGLSILFFTVFIASAMFTVDLPGVFFTDATICCALIIVAVSMSTRNLYRVRESFMFKKQVIMDNMMTPEESVELKDVSMHKNSSELSQRLLSSLTKASSGSFEDHSTERPADEPIVGAKVAPVDGAFQCEGYLEKRGKIQNSLIGYESWAKRYFLLLGTKLYGFKNEDACHDYFYNPNGKNRTSTKIIELGGYEIMVDSQVVSNQNANRGKPRFGFSLVRIDDQESERDRFFRTDSSESLNTWVKALVMASLTGDDES